jgi:hypothetical protein
LETEYGSRLMRESEYFKEKINGNEGFNWELT